MTEHQNRREYIGSSYALQTFMGKEQIIQSGIMPHIQIAVEKQIAVLKDKRTPVTDQFIDSCSVLSKGLESFAFDLSHPQLANIFLRVCFDSENNIVGYGVTPIFYDDDSHHHKHADNTFFGVLFQYEGMGLGTKLLQAQCLDLYRLGITQYHVSLWEGSENLYKKLHIPYTRTPSSFTADLSDSRAEIDVDLTHLPELEWAAAVLKQTK